MGVTGRRWSGVDFGGGSGGRGKGDGVAERFQLADVAAVLRPGDLVRYDGADHQVIALAGTSVWLRSEHGAESVVLLAYQMASPEFAVIDGARVVHERDGGWFVSTN